MIDLKRLAVGFAAVTLGTGLLTGAAPAENTVYRAALLEDRGREIGPGPGARGKEEFCRAYADRALEAEATNQDLECGFTGSAWHTRRNSHYHWCLNTPPERVREETRMRREKLESCRRGDGMEDGGAEKEAFCRTYARRAARAQELNAELDCGFAGPAWHFNRDRHYRWCLDVPRDEAEDEADMRRERLQRCRRFE
ncbi:MAG: hypothetical protein ACLFV8_13145 [Alphaproteobacteria bacterium]